MEKESALFRVVSDLARAAFRIVRVVSTVAPVAVLLVGVPRTATIPMAAVVKSLLLLYATFLSGALLLLLALVIVCGIFAGTSALRLWRLTGSAIFVECFVTTSPLQMLPAASERAIAATAVRPVVGQFAMTVRTRPW